MLMNIEQQLFTAAVELVNTRYPKDWGGAAAIRTETGKIITSIAPDVKNDGLSLCMEVGAYLQAHKLNEAVTHSLCIAREDEHADFKVLSPCGICQERLVHWGGDVMAAISTTNNQLTFKSIRELMPHHWSLVYDQPL